VRFKETFSTDIPANGKVVILPLASRDAHLGLYRTHFKISSLTAIIVGLHPRSIATAVNMAEGVGNSAVVISLGSEMKL